MGLAATLRKATLAFIPVASAAASFQSATIGTPCSFCRTNACIVLIKLKAILGHLGWAFPFRLGVTTTLTATHSRRQRASAVPIPTPSSFTQVEQLRLAQGR